MKTYTISFPAEKRTAEVQEGTSILDAVRAAGISFETPCGGTGKCGKCRVITSNPDNIYSMEDADSPSSGGDGTVLACRHLIRGSMAITIDGKDAGVEGMSVLAHGQAAEFAFQPAVTVSDSGDEESGKEGSSRCVFYNGKQIAFSDKNSRILGLAVDIGTTTLAASLIDLLDGRQLAYASALNPQSRWAGDVLSRIQAAKDPGVRTQLTDAFLNEFAVMVSQMTAEAGVSSGDIYDIVYSGNATMIHLALGADPSSLGRYPYHYSIKGGEDIPARIPFANDAARIWIPPMAGAFIGADITSGILASGLAKAGKTTLFIDIGTNGEMILALDGQLYATSTAAGPAFEGMNISCGMRAADGAIEFYEAADIGPEIRTIGSAPAIGICGSGLLDIVAEFIKTGIISSSGKLQKDGTDATPLWLKELLQKDEKGKTRVLLTNEVHLTQEDIRQVQLAKGAIRSGVEALLSEEDAEADDVIEVLIAGSFGFHVRFESLIEIGMLPGVFAGKIRAVGNTALTGAEAFLRDRSLREEIRDVIENVSLVDLSMKEGFDRIFVKSMTF